MSAAAGSFVRGFLSRAQPGLPRDDEGDVDEPDLDTWRAATARFRRTGSWFGRWRTRASCGRVLLPDSNGPTCERHGDDQVDPRTR